LLGTFILQNEILIQSHRYDLRENVNASALETWDDEFPIAKVTKVSSRVVKPPRVAESPVNFECRFHSMLKIEDCDVVVGRVVAIHIKGEYITLNGVSQNHSSIEAYFYSHAIVV